MKQLIVSLAVLGFVGLTHAEETVSEKAGATGSDAKGGMKKGWHRTKEAACGKLTGDNKAECLAKKAGNRIEEGADGVGRTAKKAKNNVDSDKE